MSIIGIPFIIPSRGLSNGPDTTAPTLVTIIVGDVSDDVIVLTYNEQLDNTSTPATGDFTVGGTAETVSSVNVSGLTVSLTLSGDIESVDTITLSYTAGVNPIRDISENNAANFVTQAVTNNTTVYLRDTNGNLILDTSGNPIELV